MEDMLDKDFIKLIEELRKSGIVINRKKKNISMKRMNTGGIKIRKPRSLELNHSNLLCLLFFYDFRIL